MQKLFQILVLHSENNNGAAQSKTHALECSAFPDDDAFLLALPSARLVGMRIFLLVEPPRDTST